MEPEDEVSTLDAKDRIGLDVCNSFNVFSNSSVVMEPIADGKTEGNVDVGKEE